MSDTRKDRERRQQSHAARLAECASLMAKDIPLGYPPVSDHFQIKRYYAMKHARGEVGTYWLHQTRTHGGAL